MNSSDAHLLSRRQWLERVSGPAAVGALGAGFFASTATAQPAVEERNLGARVYDIREFGAKGDGVTLDTAAVQAAVDACAAAKGGTVLVPAGVFVIGTVELKSNVTLHLVPQATLLGSADGKQYHAAEAIPLTGEHTMGDGNVGLLFAANAENITIEGAGTIDRQGAQFHSAVRGQPPPSGRGGNQRPHHVLFYKCTNLTVRGIFLRACAYHSVRICVCSDVKLDSLRIHSRVNGNNDGFHFISSQYVHVRIATCSVRMMHARCSGAASL